MTALNDRATGAMAYGALMQHVVPASPERLVQVPVDHVQVHKANRLGPIIPIMVDQRCITSIVSLLMDPAVAVLSS